MAKKSYGTNGTPFRSKVEEDVSETTRLLTDTVNLARRAEDIETATFRELLEQGDTIRAAKENVDDVNNISADAQVSITQLRNKLYRKKFCLWMVMITLGFINFALVVVLFRNGGTFYPHYN